MRHTAKVLGCSLLFAAVLCRCSTGAEDGRVSNIRKLIETSRYQEAQAQIQELSLNHVTDTKVQQQVLGLTREFKLALSRQRIDSAETALVPLREKLSELAGSGEIQRDLEKERAVYIATSEDTREARAQKLLYLNYEQADAALDLLVYRFTKDKSDWDQLELRLDTLVWLSQVIPYDEGLNYRYHTGAEWVQSIRFRVSDARALAELIDRWSKAYPLKLYYKKDGRVVAEAVKKYDRWAGQQQRLLLYGRLDEERQQLEHQIRINQKAVERLTKALSEVNP